MRLPDFVVIGAAKAGTTSLYALLDRHPDIFMPQVKEPEFFARDDRYAAGITAYAEAFAEARDDQIVGEASTIYSLSPLFPDAASRMAEHLPQARLVYVMRQPVDRAYSFYVQIIKNYQNVTGDAAVHRSFEEFIDPGRHAIAAPRETVFSSTNAHLPDVTELCLAGSDYVHQIETWLAHFPRDRMLFLKFEDFAADGPGTLRKMTDFLGVAPLPDNVFEAEGVTRNVAADHFRDWGDRVALERMRAKAGGLWQLRQLLPKGLRKALKGRLAAGRKAGRGDADHVPPRMLPETRARLSERFGAQVPRLRELTGLDFDDWRL